MLSLTLAACAVGAAFFLGWTFAAVCAAYLAGSVVYTQLLKRLVIVDVLAIGALFILRVLAGSVAADVVASDWLLVMAGLLAVFLGLCKRRHELLLLREQAGAHREVLSEYTPTFLDVGISLTTATALVTYLLYARDPAVVARVGSSGLLLGAPVALYGLLRYLHLVYSREESPTEVLLSDPGVLGAGALFAVVCGVVLYV